MLELLIGNRNYSSWSLRAWLFLRESGLAFREERVALFEPGWVEKVEAWSPARRVPVLRDGEITVWDSLAIFAHVRERHPEAVGWPEAPQPRAHARSIVAEMHAGFLAVRQELPQNLRARTPRPLETLSPACRAEIERIRSLWVTCRERHAEDGPWLFGGFTLADVMYAPVALRFETYAISVPDAAADFVDAVHELPSIRDWVAAAREEPERLEFIDSLAPIEGAPLTLG